MHHPSPISRSMGFALFVFATSQIHAAVFHLQEPGTPHSLGTAGVANPTSIESAHASWTNPAATAFLQQDHVYVGAQLVLPSIEFDSGVANASGGDTGNAGNASWCRACFMCTPVTSGDV